MILVLSCTDSRVTVSELSLIWVWSKLQERSKQCSWPYPNKDQDAKPQSGTSIVLQSPKSGLKGHGCSLHLQNHSEGKKSKDGCIKNHWPYQNQDQDSNPSEETPASSKDPNQDSKVMDFLCTFNMKIKTICKSRSRYQTPARNLQHHPKLQIRT